MRSTVKMILYIVLLDVKYYITFFYSIQKIFTQVEQVNMNGMRSCAVGYSKSKKKAENRCSRLAVDAIEIFHVTG